ncbi:MAG: C25 family cysteine peptidase, partial [Candidatus Marinimicrobia bacterium]|nr:C25 family cysteine peptidase [Candidatus Neomarinimicrobiota bacterium]
MKNITTLLLLSVSLVSANFQLPINGGSAEVTLHQEESTLLKVNITMGDLDLQQINSPDGMFTRLTLPGYHTSNRIGHPELPQIHNLIEIPQGAEARIEIEHEDYEIIHLEDYGIIDPLFPRQPSLSKSQHPSEAPFEWNQNIYYINDFIGEETVSIQEKGILRSIRIANLIVRPVNYNPVTNEVKVITDLQLSIYFDGADMVETERLKTQYYSPYFEANYHQIKNYQSPELRDDLVHYPLSYLIITNPLFESQLADFVEWKTQKGFVVQVANTSDIGSSTSAIKSYIQDLYENPTSEFPAPSFVLFIGDVAQVPTFNGNTGSHVTDLYYVEFTGDKLPEMYHGRFSAQNSSQLQIQLDKSLMYEKFEMPDPSYLEEVLMISGVDGSFAPTHGNGQINYGTDYYFNEEHGIYSHTYLYPASD